MAANQPQNTAYYYSQPMNARRLNNQPNLQTIYWPYSYGTYSPATPTTPFSSGIHNFYSGQAMSPPTVTSFTPTTPLPIGFYLPSLPATPHSFNFQPRRNSPRFSFDRPHQGLLYKTALCQNYKNHGDCEFKGKCRFAHGIHELRLPRLHPKYKTVICRNFANTGYCQYGPRCTFIHERESAGTRVVQNSRYSHRGGSGKHYAKKTIKAMEEEKATEEKSEEESGTASKTDINESDQLDETQKLAEEMESKVNI